MQYIVDVCMLLHVQVDGHMQVVIVTKTSNHYHRKRSQALTKMYGCCNYELAAEKASHSFDNRVGRCDLSCVKRIFLIYNKKERQFDKIYFVSNRGKVLPTLTLKAPIITPNLFDMSIKIIQYQLAGIFVGDLDFLVHFLGHQGASASWLYMFCLACQDRLSDYFQLGFDARRFAKRRKMYLIQEY